MLNPFQTIPENPNILACAGQSIDLSVRITDIDKASCSIGTFEIDFPNSTYEYKFSTTSTEATFSGGVSSIIVGDFATMPNNNTLTNIQGDTFLTHISQNAALTIKNTWSGAPIIIDLLITDLGGQLPNGHSGSPVDPSVTMNFRITPATKIPMTAMKLGTTPPENSWEPYSLTTGLKFIYVGLPDPAPVYNGLAVIETFKAPKAAGVFTKNDILTSWIYSSNLPSTVTADDIAPMIFSTANTNTFGFNTVNEFDDTHAGFALMPGLDLTKIFTQDAIKNKRVGYRLDQDFDCCGNKLMMNNEISRRIDLNSTPPTYELKKKH